MVDILEYTEKMIAILTSLVQSKSMLLSNNSRKRVLRYKLILKELVLLKDDIECRICPPEDLDHNTHKEYTKALDYYFNTICQILIDVDSKCLSFENSDGNAIYTSYFGNWKNFPENLIPIAISRFSPRGVTFKTCSELAPSTELLKGYKNNTISKEEYVVQYNEQLAKLDVHKYGKALHGHILICYEKVGDFCHRHLVATWLKKAGYSVYELSTKQILNN